MTLIMKIVSHRGKPDVAMVTSLSADNSLPTEEPNNWSLVNRGGDSNANLAKIVFSPHQARDHLSQLRIATTWNELQRAAVLDYRIQTGPPASNLLPSDPVSNPEGGLMLDLPDSGTDMQAVDYDRLPDFRANNLSFPWAHPSGIFGFTTTWPGMAEDSGASGVMGPTSRNCRGSTYGTRPVQTVSTGLVRRSWWVSADPAFGYIARGLWLRNGKLIALAARFKRPGLLAKG